MVAADWLSAYGTEAGIALTIERVSRRIRRRGHPLSGAIEELTANRRLLDDHFLEFFPSLIDFCSGHTGTPLGSRKNRFYHSYE